MSSQFEIQRFSRTEIDRWLNLRGFESDYPFVAANATSDEPVPTAPRNCHVWVDQTKLMAAFEEWGLNANWFRALNGHQWLKNCRRQVGIGGHKSKLALFCPFAVMEGMTKHIKGRDKDKMLTFDKGKRILRSHFPKAYEEHIPDYLDD